MGYDRGDAAEGGGARDSPYPYILIYRWCPQLAARLGWRCRSSCASYAIPRHAFSPKRPCWKDLLRMLASLCGKRPVEIRDHAFVLLMAVYGLRVGDVVGLQLGDVDFSQRILTVRRKKNLVTRVTQPNVGGLPQSHFFLNLVCRRSSPSMRQNPSRSKSESHIQIDSCAYFSMHSAG
jgi:integrase